MTFADFLNTDYAEGITERAAIIAATERISQEAAELIAADQYTRLYITHGQKDLFEDEK